MIPTIKVLIDSPLDFSAWRGNFDPNTDAQNLRLVMGTSRGHAFILSPTKDPGNPVRVDLVDEREKGLGRAHVNTVFTANFCPRDSNLIATASDGSGRRFRNTGLEKDTDYGSMKVWRYSKWKRKWMREAVLHNDQGCAVYSANFHPDRSQRSPQIVTASDDGTTRLYTRTGRRRWKEVIFPYYGKATRKAIVHRALISGPSGLSYIMAFQNNNSIIVYPIEGRSKELRPVQILPLPLNSTVSMRILQSAMSETGKCAIAWSLAEEGKVFKRGLTLVHEDGTPKTLEIPMICAVGLSPDGNHLAVGTFGEGEQKEGTYVSLWNISGAEPREVGDTASRFVGSGVGLRHLVFSPPFTRPNGQKAVGLLISAVHTEGGTAGAWVQLIDGQGNTIAERQTIMSPDDEPSIFKHAEWHPTVPLTAFLTATYFDGTTKLGSAGKTGRAKVFTIQLP